MGGISGDIQRKEKKNRKTRQKIQEGRSSLGKRKKNSKIISPKEHTDNSTYRNYIHRIN